jgi:hypothetical protein
VSVSSVEVGSSRTESALLYTRCLSSISALDAYASLAKRIRNGGRLRERTRYGNVSRITGSARVGSASLHY